MIRISPAEHAAAALTGRQIPPWLASEFVEGYVRWREAANAAGEAYEHWAGAEREARAEAFAAYRAALDGEEAVACTYRASAERISERER
jgi:predicted DNA-binding transcriptional regulator YafY